MTPERFQHIEELYHQARQHSESDRDAWLRRECTSDTELYEEVRSLLIAGSSGGIGEELAWDAAAAMFSSEVPGITTGQVLREYKIVATVGERSTGTVFCAQDLNRQREVAVHVFSKAIAGDPTTVGRMKRRVKTLMGVQHPNIATTLDQQEIADLYFVVQEAVSGQSLANLLQNGPLPPDDAIRFGRQICAALETLHHKGVVHGHLNTGNVQITASRQLKLVDLGWARLNAEDDAGRKEDIFAFGALLFEMITAHPAFDIAGSGPDWTRIPRPARPLLPLLKRCLAGDPYERFHDAADVEHLLTDIVLPSSWIRTRLWFLVAAAVVLLLLSVVALLRR